MSVVPPEPQGYLDYESQMRKSIYDPYHYPAQDQEEYEARMMKFRYEPIPKEYAIEICPICRVPNGGKCCHFEERFGQLTFKNCLVCGKYGEHWTESCPDRALKCGTVTDDKHPELGLDEVADQFPAFDQEEYEARMRKFRYDPIPEKFARERCPICRVPNGGKCCHFEDRFGQLTLKNCLVCGKYGEHWTDSCPDRASVVDHKHHPIIEARLRDLKCGPLPEKFAIERCVVCCVAIDGDFWKFKDRFVHVRLKMCLACGTYGERGTKGFPEYRSKCDSVIGHKRPATELEGGAAKHRASPITYLP